MANPTLQSILLTTSPLDSARSLPSSPAVNVSILPPDDDPNPTQSRKIRFAPLPVVPEPDGLEDDTQRDESPGPEIMESIPSTPTSVPPPPLPPVMGFNPSTSSTSSLQSLPLPKNSFSRFIKPLFTPWSKSVSAPSSASGDSPPLSRISSIESSQSLRVGPPLDRWTSAGSVRSFMSDGGRPQSRRHKKSTSFSSSLNPLAHRSKSTPLPAKQYTPSAKPGMRMLNGRVYGRKRPYSQASIDPFANVRTTEPEFVEWGYGGMGSNKSNTTSSMGSAWKVVQNGTNSSSFGNDEDDSSGMAWVKKRRAERERAKLEAEKNEQEHGDAEIPQPTITEEEAQETPRLPKEDNIPHPPIDTPTVAPAEEPHERPEHVTTAVNLPPHRLHKRETSFSHRVQTPQVESPTQDKSSFGVGVFDMEPDEVPEVTPETPEPSTGSASEDDGDEELSSSDGGDEDESDSYSEEEKNAHSKTALGAGVEKVSRHKDAPQPKTPNLPHSLLLPTPNTAAIEA